MARWLGGQVSQVSQGAGVSILRYIGISIPIKYSNFSGFYKKLGPFYKKLRCDKFGNWSISTKNALNNQIQSSIKIDMYIVRNCCLPIANLETNLLKPVFYLQKMTNFVKTRTFYKKLPLFIKNSILHIYKKLKPLIWAFIKNSIFGNNRDPCRLDRRDVKYKAGIKKRQNQY